MKVDARIENPKTDSKIFAYTRWDALPAAAGLLHLAFFFALFFLFPHLPIWAMIVLGVIYAVAINANINGVSHNFIHSPYFRSPLLNRLFSLSESVACCFSQTYYDVVHTQHHKGNSDRPGEDGETIDWVSIYKHGHDDEPENVWSYVFLSYFRDNPVVIKRELVKRGKAELRWGNLEIAAFITTLVVMGIFNWRFLVYFLPFMYFGQCLSFLNGYYRHFGGNPDEPIAWGVSSYGKVYNWLFFNNGYHAEHHFRPSVHWTRMHALFEKIQHAQRAAGTRVIGPAHMFGFLDPNLPAGSAKPAAADTTGNPAPVAS